MNFALLTGMAVMLVGIFFTWYQIYQLVTMDARRRGLTHPRLIGFLASGGHQGEGLLVYLLARKKYRVISDDPEMVVQISRYKKKAGAGIAFMAAGDVIAVVGITMM